MFDNKFNLYRLELCPETLKNKSSNEVVEVDYIFKILQCGTLSIYSLLQASKNGQII